MTARDTLDAAISEKDFQQTVIDLAEANGWHTWRDSYSRRNDAGFPDLLAVRGAVLLFIEFKTQRGKVRPEQQAFIDRLKQIKYVSADVLRPSDWPEIVRVLTARAR
mgnify:CR=1 FL=1